MRFLGIPLILAATLFLTVACGGDDSTKNGATPTNDGGSSGGADQTLKEYFQQLGNVLDNVDSQSNQINGKYLNAGVDPDQTRKYIAEFLPLIARALSDIRNLDAPGAVKQQHDNLVSAIQDVVAVDTALSKDIQDIDSAADLKAYLESRQSDYTAKTDAVNANCSDLQTVANSNSLGIDLKCSGPSSTTPSPTGPAATR